MQYWDNLVSILRSTQPRFSPEWVRIWVGSLLQILRPTFSRRKRKKRPEISRFQVFYGCGGRTRTCGLRVMSCSEAPIPCSATVSVTFWHQKRPKPGGQPLCSKAIFHANGSNLGRKWVRQKATRNAADAMLIKEKSLSIFSSALYRQPTATQPMLCNNQRKGISIFFLLHYTAPPA